MAVFYGSGKHLLNGWFFCFICFLHFLFSILKLFPLNYIVTQLLTLLLNNIWLRNSAIEHLDFTSLIQYVGPRVRVGQASAQWDLLLFYLLPAFTSPGCFPTNDMQLPSSHIPLPLRSGHLNIKDVQCVDKNDGCKISYLHILSCDRAGFPDLKLFPINLKNYN